jgi:hypothetical protein
MEVEVKKVTRGKKGGERRRKTSNWSPVTKKDGHQ